MRPHRQVAPHAGAWIETINQYIFTIFPKVAPHAGAWIETRDGRGFGAVGAVAPHAGAWIETVDVATGQRLGNCRSPRGGVD